MKQRKIYFNIKDKVPNKQRNHVVSKIMLLGGNGCCIAG